MADRLYTLPRKHCIKHKALIDQLFAQGKGITSYPLRLQIGTTSTVDVHYQVGFSVPKRNWKRAVDRNTIKRLLRESYRHLHHELTDPYLGAKESLLVFVLYIGKELPSRHTIDKALVKGFQKYHRS